MKLCFFNILAYYIFSKVKKKLLNIFSFFNIFDLFFIFSRHKKGTR